MPHLGSHLCHACYIRIGAYGYPCLELLATACSYYRNCNVLTIEDTDDATIPLAYLESKEFLISTETDSSILGIKPNMVKCILHEETGTFCFCGN